MSPNVALAFAAAAAPTAAVAASVPAGMPAADATVAVTSALLGTVQVPAASLFTFPAGVFGFAECRSFALLPAGRDGLFWLQSLDHAALAFLLADPFPHFPQYTVELSALDRGELCAASAGDVAVLCVVTLPPTRGELPTANLQGPIALNFAERRGRQVALGETAWGVRCPLDLGAPAE